MENGFFTEIARAFQVGGFWMIPIAFCLLTALIITFERFVRLYLHYPVDGSSFMFEVQKAILSGDIDGAIRLCNGSEKALLPRVIKAGLQRAARDEQQIQNAIDAASLEVIPRLERRISYLSMLANVATLFGLLGTISGLIRAFAAIANTDAAKKAEILAHGISEAMTATAFGLITAIFAMVAHSLLSNRSNRLLEDIDEFGVKLLDLLSARRYRSAQKE